jgi:hypothetical protein
MKHLMIIFSLVAVFLTGGLFAQESLAEEKEKQSRYNNQTKNANQVQTKGQHGSGFVDENGDGYNDNAPDEDGDGIPNGKDEDYDGVKARKGSNAKGFVDTDGDGINDNALDDDKDGIPNGQDDDFVRPQDGSGRMNKSGNGQGNGMKGNVDGSGMGTGDCDGTGPKGSAKKGGKK